MINELRYYLGEIKKEMLLDESCGRPAFKPTYIVTAVVLPTGAIELAVNNTNILEKIDYILGAYDDDMRLISNKEVYMSNVMIV